MQRGVRLQEVKKFRVLVEKFQGPDRSLVSATGRRPLTRVRCPLAEVRLYLNIRAVSEVSYSFLSIRS